MWRLGEGRVGKVEDRGREWKMGAVGGWAKCGGE